MSNPCPNCGEVNQWDAYHIEDEGWRLWCRTCEFDESEDDHLRRLEEEE
jgi:predicted RNA-binding Zn-ribbon protein involved in translation (DUF1610 family)